MRVIGWAKNNVALIAIGVVTVVIAMALGSWSMGLGGGVTLGIALATAVVAWAIFRRRHGDVIPAGGHWPLPKVGTSVLMALALVLVAIQVVPYGRAHSNPPITGEPAWDSPRTRELVAIDCFDCHSNEVEYPWYANVAPMSWAVESHIDSGRDKVN